MQLRRAHALERARTFGNSRDPLDAALPSSSPGEPVGANSTAGMPSRDRAVLAAIVLAAFLVRLAWALFAHVDVRRRFFLDTSMYDLLARHLAHGMGFTGYRVQPIAFYAPGYPAILAIAYRAFGEELAVAWVLNAVLGALSCALVHVLGSRLFSRRVGLAAAAVLALFPSQIVAASLTMTEVVFCFLFTAAIYLFVRWTDEDRAAWRWFAFGLLLGVASLVRGVALPFVAVPFVCWIGLVGLRVAITRSAVTAAGLALVVLPWTARNWIVMGAPILISADAPYAFFNAHNPLAFGGQSFAINQLRRQEWPWLAQLRLSEREVEEARLELRYGLKYMLTHPRHEIELIPHRLFLFYAGDHHGIVPGKGSAAAEAIADGYYLLILLLAVPGLRGTIADRRARVLPFTIAYFSFLHGVVFFGDPRYHAPLVPIFAILAPRGAAELWLLARKLRSPAKSPHGASYVAGAQ